jgi:dihydroneopterin aldolase
MNTSKKQILSIEGMRFESNHGVYESEKNGLAPFEIDVFIEGHFSVSMNSDLLSDTIDYQTVHAICAEEMGIHSDLIEHVAFRILHSLRYQIPSSFEIKVVVHKLTPPMNGYVAKTRFEVIG